MFVVFQNERRLRDFKDLSKASNYALEKIQILLQSYGYDLDDTYIDKYYIGGVLVLSSYKLPHIKFKIMQCENGVVQ